jgi:hypothetical protein
LVGANKTSRKNQAWASRLFDEWNRRRARFEESAKQSGVSKNAWSKPVSNSLMQMGKKARACGLPSPDTSDQYISTLLLWMDYQALLSTTKTNHIYSKICLTP